MSHRTKRRRTSVSVRLNVGQIQLLSRIVDTTRADAVLDDDSTDQEIRRFQLLDDIMRKLDAAIESLAR
jgi:hypothetical protein